MSRTGISKNVQQPEKKCLNCKYWKGARRENFIIGFLTIAGKCTTGYCKKDALTNRRNKK